MRVTYQDCGCIALPDEVVVALGLSAGSALDVSYDPDSKTVSLIAAEPLVAGMEISTGTACRIRTAGK